MKQLLIQIGQRTLGLSLAVIAGILPCCGHVVHSHAVDFHPSPSSISGNFLNALDHLKILLLVLWVLVCAPLVIEHFRHRPAKDVPISN